MLSSVALIASAVVFALAMALVLRSEFPGMGVAAACAVGAATATTLTSLALPRDVGWLGVGGGAIVGLGLVLWLTEATMHEALLIMAVFLAVFPLVRLMLSS
jgi:hypothetical protein